VGLLLWAQRAGDTIAAHNLLAATALRAAAVAGSATLSADAS